MRHYRYAAALVICAVAVLFAVALYVGPVSAYLDERQVRATVDGFGLQLQRVPLAADEEQLRRDLDAYEPFVTDELLARWREDTSLAPGRETSSPWPDRLHIRHVTRQANTYIVEANIVLMTSVEEESPEDDAGIVPVMMLLTEENGEWQIAAFEEQRHEEG